MAMLNVTPAHAIIQEIKTIQSSLAAGRNEEMLQFCLNRAMYLSELSKKAKDYGLKVEVSTSYDLARTLWSHDERPAAIRILQGLTMREDILTQTIQVTAAEILADLVSNVSLIVLRTLTPLHRVRK